jgi:hypothetical protein
MSNFAYRFPQRCPKEPVKSRRYSLLCRRYAIWCSKRRNEKIEKKVKGKKWRRKENRKKIKEWIIYFLKLGFIIYNDYSLWILIVDVVDILCNIWLFVLFKILKNICYISNLFSNKINDNKIYDFSKNILNKTNCQTLCKKLTASTIKIQREYIIIE